MLICKKAVIVIEDWGVKMIKAVYSSKYSMPNLRLAPSFTAETSSPIPESQKFKYTKQKSLTKQEKKFLESNLDIFRKLEGKLIKGIPEAFYPNSITNKIMQKLHPRKNGVIIYAGALKDKAFQANFQANIEKTRKLGRLLVENGKHIITAGGPNYMEEVARGALEAGGHTVACAMTRIPDTNPKLYKEIYYHDIISERMNASGGYEIRGVHTIALPGGGGTLHEVLQKANELWYAFNPYKSQKAIVLVDFDGFYENGFMPFLKSTVDAGKTKPGFLDLFKVVKTPEEAVAIIMDKTIPFVKGKLKTIV